MDKRFQVFVSSTYSDLEDERREITQALLELDAIPSGMELFPAANDDQWTLIKRVIDDCDYYLVIVAGRYGSTGPEGISFTEMEYRYALEQGKPIVAFLHKAPEKISAERTEKNEPERQKLRNFRALCEKKVVRYWTSPVELGSVVSRSLIKLFRDYPAVGWVRGDAVTSQDAQIEILRLRKKLEEVQEQLNRERTSAPPGAQKYSQGDETFEFHYRCSLEKQEGFLTERRSLSGMELISWDEVFSTISPLLIDEASEVKIKQKLNEFAWKNLYPDAAVLVSKNKNISGFNIEKITVQDDTFQTIKVQFRALGLIDKSVKNRSIKDAETYWTLTPYGEHQMNALRAITREESNQ